MLASQIGLRRQSDGKKPMEMKRDDDRTSIKSGNQARQKMMNYFISSRRSGDPSGKIM